MKNEEMEKCMEESFYAGKEILLHAINLDYKDGSPAFALLFAIAFQHIQSYHDGILGTDKDEADKMLFETLTYVLEGVRLNVNKHIKENSH